MQRMGRMPGIDPPSRTITDYNDDDPIEIKTVAPPTTGASTGADAQEVTVSMNFGQSRLIVGTDQ
jgi:hypothetical protein